VKQLRVFLEGGVKRYNWANMREACNVFKSKNFKRALIVANQK